MRDSGSTLHREAPAQRSLRFAVLFMTDINRSRKYASQPGHRALAGFLSPLALLAVYLAVYLLSTEVFHGRLGGTRYQLRLFQSVWHQRFFTPLLTTEQWIRPADPEFYGHVRNGASLPPPDEDERSARRGFDSPNPRATPTALIWESTAVRVSTGFSSLGCWLPITMRQR